MIEQTLSIIKPDAVERNLENKIKSFFQKKRDFFGQKSALKGPELVQ